MDQHAGTTSTNSQTGKQVFIGAGLPILPKCLIDKMRNWEYINFNELIPFCDPGAEEEHDLNTNPDHYPPRSHPKRPQTYILVPTMG